MIPSPHILSIASNEASPSFIFSAMPGVRTLSFGVFIPSGSLNESSFNQGISHLIEHMVFKGSKDYSCRDISRIPEQLGGRINAFTGHDVTGYFIEGLKDHLSIHARLLSHLVFHPLFPESELSKEKDVVLQEISMYHDDPQSFSNDLIFETAFGSDQPLGRSITGTQDIVSSLTRDDLLAFHQHHYHPQRCVVICCGDIDLQTTPSQIIPLFQSDRLHSSRFHQGNVERPPLSSFLCDFSLACRPLDQTQVALALPTVSACDPLHWDDLLAVQALSHGMSSPLFHRLREELGLVYDLQLDIQANSSQGLVVFECGTQASQVSSALQSLSDLLQNASAHIHEEDLLRAKNSLIFSKAQELQHPASYMQSLMDDWLHQEPFLTHDSLKQRLDHIHLPAIISRYQAWISQAPSLSVVTSSSSKRLFNAAFKKTFLQPLQSWPPQR